VDRSSSACSVPSLGTEAEKKLCPFFATTKDERHKPSTLSEGMIGSIADAHSRNAKDRISAGVLVGKSPLRLGGVSHNPASFPREARYS